MHNADIHIHPPTHYSDILNASSAIQGQPTNWSRRQLFGCSLISTLLANQVFSFINIIDFWWINKCTRILLLTHKLRHVHWLADVCDMLHLWTCLDVTQHLTHKHPPSFLFNLDIFFFHSRLLVTNELHFTYEFGEQMLMGLKMHMMWL